MQLPRLEHPDRYVSLYVVDFGESVGVGYTAEEVATLLDSEAYRHVHVYRIHRASPDGTLELRGVGRLRFLLETGTFFYAADKPAGRRDYSNLRALARRTPPPCRAELFLAELPRPSSLAFVVGLVYPAEHDQDVARWLLDNNVTAGSRADGGIRRLRAVRHEAHIIESAQLHAAPARRSRTPEEVFASVGRTIQRTA